MQCEGEATAGLEAIDGAADFDDGASTSLRCRLLNIRGLSRAMRYDVDGDIRGLACGLEDLRSAVALAPGCETPESRFKLEEDLAVALVRCGEQSSDGALLREAASLLADLLKGAAARDVPPELHRLVNARGVAELRLGVISGDRGMVEKACRDLQDFLRRPGLDAQARSQTMKNVVAALAENARQNRSERVYSSLIQLLDGLIGNGRPDQTFFLHYRATARLRLAELADDASLVEPAIGDIRHSLDLLEDRPGPRVTALHSLAQAHFRLAGKRDPEENCSKAILHLDEALRLARAEAGGTDGRVIRLLADRAAYRHALGALGGDAQCLAGAERDFEAALSRLSPEAAPMLYAQIASGLFLLRYRQNRWEAAIGAFAAVERAWSIIVADPILSSEVHAQRAVEMSGHYARAALCHIRLGSIGDAAAAVDRGRAQQLTIALSLNDAGPHGLSSETMEGIEDAARNWERVRRIGSDRECRDAWRRYLDLRRRAGLDNTMRSLDAQGLVRAAPAEGALLQLFGIDGWTAALVIRRAEPHFVPIELPQAAAQSIGRLLHGEATGERSGWHASYKRFSADAAEDPEGERTRFAQWTQAVRHCMNVLGAAVMGTIHARLKEAGIEPGSPIVISPPGELAALPMATAPLPDGSRFNDHWSVSMVPNALFAAPDPSEARSGAPHSLLTISEPHEPMAGTGILPFAAREARLVGAGFPAGRWRHLQGLDANIEHVMDAFAEASVVHVACHGVYDWERPDRSGIELAGGSRLTIARLKATPRSTVRTRLLVLSCCETGIAGQTLPPDEFVGILPAFLQCGVRAAIGTLWAVYDDAAMLFCDRFYRNFLDRSGRQACDPATALARAQDWLRGVTLGELVDEGLISAEEGRELAEARFGRMRLRMRRTPSRRGPAAGAAEPGGAGALPPGLRNFRPYSSPVDWAAYVVVGR